MAEELDSFYPLQIFSISDAEKQLIIKIMIMGRDAGIYRRKELYASYKNWIKNKYEDNSLHPFRYIIDNRSSAIQKIVKKSDIVYDKWVFLYNYIMTEFRGVCVVKKSSNILEYVDHLYNEGINSGRYKYDMNIANRDFMALDTGTAEVDEEHHGLYIGFRYSSRGTDVITAALRVSVSPQGRTIFRSRVFNEIQGRETRGYVYKINSIIYLFGFLNDGHAFEYYALHSDGKGSTILFGIMSTVDGNGIPHSKQCCFVKAEKISGVSELVKKETEEAVFTTEPFNKLRILLKKAITGKFILKTMGDNDNKLDIRQYLASKNIVSARNK